MAGGAPTMRATFDDLYEDRHPFLAEVMWLSWAEHPDEYNKLGNIQTSSRMKETDFMVAELGQFEQKPEGTPIRTDSISPSFSKDFLHVTWAKGVEVTMEALEDDQDSIMMDQARALGYSARQTIETIAANEWFNNAFTTATSADGQPIYGTHTTALGFTIDNSFAVDLDVGGVEAMLTHFAELVSEAGNKIRMQARMIIVPPTLQFAAREIVESVTRSDNNTGAKNVLQEFNLQVFVSHYLNSSTAWFMWAEPSMIKAKWYWRKRPTPVKDTRYTNQSGLTGLIFRQSVGVSDYRGLAGSQPST